MSLQQTPSDAPESHGNGPYDSATNCSTHGRSMARRKQVYNPNEKIYVGMNMPTSISHIGSPSAKAQIGWRVEALGRLETAGLVNGDL